MAVQKTIIKAENMRAVVHLYASAVGDSSTITLAELAASDQTSSSSVALSVSIAAAYSNVSDSVDSSIVVRRGNSSGTVVLDMHGCSDYPGANAMPALALNSTSSIFVLFEAPGMLMLDLRKLDGFVTPNRNVGV